MIIESDSDDRLVSAIAIFCTVQIFTASVTHSWHCVVNYQHSLSRTMQTIHRFFNGPTPEERVRNWQTKLRSESRQLDREIRQVCLLIISGKLQELNLLIQLDMAAKKARQTVKQLAAKGDLKSARILAKEVVRSDKQKDRLSVGKARLGSIGTQLSQQIG